MRLFTSTRTSRIILLFCFTFSLIFGNQLNAQDNQSDFLKAPYLMLSQNKSQIILLWQLNLTKICDVYYGTDSVYLDKRIQSEEYNTDHQHQYFFDSLDLNTKYYYKIVSNQFIKKGSFRSNPNADIEHFSFIAYGDTRTFPENHNLVAKQIIKVVQQDTSAQTFVVSTGDVVANGNIEEDWQNQFFDPQYKYIQKLLANIPYMVSMGNHEGQGALFAKYFPSDFYQNDRYYYSFNYGNVHFIALDQMVDLKPGSIQYEWLIKDFEANHQPWTIVLLHKPGFTAGGHSNNKLVKKVLQPIFKKYGVKLVLAGHNHYYSRAEVDGIQHITTGGGGAPLYSPKANKKHIIKVDKSYHFCKIEVKSDNLWVSVIRSDGSIIEEFKIDK